MDIRQRVGGLPLPPQNIMDKTDDNNFGMEKGARSRSNDPQEYIKQDDDDNNRLQSNNSDSDVNDKDNLNNIQSKSFVCFKDISVRVKSGKLWNAPFKCVQVAARELSVLLILLETLVLLGGYLMILGVHHSIRYGLKKLRYKSYPEDNSRHNHHVPIRNRYPQQVVRPGGVPRPVPRGRMAGG